MQNEFIHIFYWNIITGAIMCKQNFNVVVVELILTELLGIKMHHIQANYMFKII